MKKNEANSFSALAQNAKQYGPIIIRFGQPKVQENINQPNSNQQDIVRVETKHISLVPPKPEYNKAIHEVVSDSERMNLFHNGLPKDEAFVQRTQLSYAENFNKNNVLPRCNVILNEDKSVLGSVIAGGAWDYAQTLGDVAKHSLLLQQGKSGVAEVFGFGTKKYDNIGASEVVYAQVAYLAFLANGGVVKPFVQNYEKPVQHPNQIHYHLNMKNHEHQKLQGLYATASPQSEAAEHILKKFGFYQISGNVERTFKITFPTNLKDSTEYMLKTLTQPKVQESTQTSITILDQKSGNIHKLSEGNACTNLETKVVRNYYEANLEGIKVVYAKPKTQKINENVQQVDKSEPIHAFFVGEETTQFDPKFLQEPYIDFGQLNALLGEEGVANTTFELHFVA